ncbi:MAG: hypothetical protein LWX07_06615 [Bacteroidetes bacterium]|nr:hypothetical protein [Bacteroidota bacterium]
MKLKVTIDVFSGLPNPSFTLGDKDSKTFLNKVKLQSGIKAKENVISPFHLGYRGIIIEQTEEAVSDFPKTMYLSGKFAFGTEESFEILNNDAESYALNFLDKVRNIELKPDFPVFLQKEMDRVKILRDKIDYNKILKLKWPILTKVGPCYCAPVYEPKWWNDAGQIQYNNNCYNYSTNYRTDTFAQPGQASGHLRSVPISSCDDSAGYTGPKSAAVSDGLIDTPNADNKCPRPGHLVALVIAPPPAFGGYGDFHWYRKGNNGHWTHKPGGGQATNLDSSGNIILDPRNADRGPYTVFCTFMKVLHGHIKLQ